MTKKKTTIETTESGYKVSLEYSTKAKAVKALETYLDADNLEEEEDKKEVFLQEIFKEDKEIL